jgi:hypothetical protein
MADIVESVGRQPGDELRAETSQIAVTSPLHVAFVPVTRPYRCPQTDVHARRESSAAPGPRLPMKPAVTSHYWGRR